MPKTYFHENKDWNSYRQRLSCVSFRLRLTSTKTRIETYGHESGVYTQTMPKTYFHENKDWNRVAVTDKVKKDEA